MIKIVSVGALLLDQIASVSRFPKEDDEVFVSQLQQLPGGSAANFAVYCARLGAESAFVGAVGEDAFGDFLLEDMLNEHVDVSHVVRYPNHPTGTVFVAVDGNGQREMFAFSGAANALDAKDVSPLNYGHMHIADLENLKPLEELASWFKGTVSVGAGALIAEKGKEAAGLLSHCDYLICSSEEVIMLSGERELKPGMERLLSSNKRLKLIVATQGADGVIAYDGRYYSEPAFRVKVVDTTGAGDSFAAGFLLHYIKTKDVASALRAGNAAAAATIQAKGARTGLTRANITCIGD
jgi:ribokinase